MGKFWSFIASDDGAVTVDWVILAAALAGLAALISSMIEGGAMGLANTVAAFMSNWSFG